MKKTRYEWDKERLQMYLRYLRGAAGLSAEKLANKIGVSKQALSFLEFNEDRSNNREMNKMQYIAIRSAIEEEYIKQPDNINLRDCYDLVFSDPEFYEKNKDKIEYILYQAVEDSKKAKKDNKKVGKKLNSNAIIAGGAVAAGAALTGVTAATVAIGGLAAFTFPMAFALGRSLSDLKDEIGKSKSKNKVKKGENMVRASESIHHRQWLSDAFEADVETESN